jgi:CPA1 family monovalent cation:H+ antiporter
MEDLLRVETVLIALLAVIAAVAFLVRWLRLPYTLALVVIGLALSATRVVPFGVNAPDIAPSIILAVLIPPLVFEAAFHLEVDHLRTSLGHAALLAVPGVVLVALFTGAFLSLALGAPLPVMLVFGALISATDPVAVLAVFRTSGAPRRLVYLVEGESLLNDGTAIVLFRITLAMAIAGTLEPVSGFLQFIWVSLGGLAVGVACGLLFARLIARMDDYLVETTLTTVLAYGSFLLAEQVHVSGVLAVVAAGVIAGNVGVRTMSPTTRTVLLSFWEYVTFLANSAVFLLIGLAVDIPTLRADLTSIGWAVAAILLGRALLVYGLSRPFDRYFGHLPIAWRHVLFWGGLRGAIALALALSLPAELGPWRETLRAMAFGVVLFTLLVQGTTMRFLMARLGLLSSEGVRSEYQARRARLFALRAGSDQVRRMTREDLMSDSAHEFLENEYQLETREAAAEFQQFQANHPELGTEEVAMARREALLAERSALQTLLRRGELSPDAYRDLAGAVDRRLSELADGLVPDDTPPSTPATADESGRGTAPPTEQESG